MAHTTIDLRSDTLSMPTEEMLQSVQTAALGDDSRDGDPTVIELEALAAEMMGMEAGLLNPSGTMSNLVAMRTHIEPGATAVVEQSAHLYGAEIGGIAAACGLLVLPVSGHYGAMDLDELRFAVRKVGTLFPTRGMICLENTHNAAGGTLIPLAHIHSGGAQAARAELLPQAALARFQDASLQSGGETISQGLLLGKQIGSLARIGLDVGGHACDDLVRALGPPLRIADAVVADGVSHHALLRLGAAMRIGGVGVLAMLRGRGLEDPSERLALDVLGRLQAAELAKGGVQIDQFDQGLGHAPGRSHLGIPNHQGHVGVALEVGVLAP